MASRPSDRRPPSAAKSTVEYIADRCTAERDRVRDYLGGRGISAAALDAAFAARTLGFNSWTARRSPPATSATAAAAAFVVRAPGDARVVAVDMRYVDPALNGGVKTQTQGDKAGYGWTADARRLERAKRVIIVSAINALSIGTCALPGTRAGCAASRTSSASTSRSCAASRSRSAWTTTSRSRKATRAPGSAPAPGVGAPRTADRARHQCGAGRPVGLAGGSGGRRRPAHADQRRERLPATARPGRPRARARPARAVARRRPAGRRLAPAGRASSCRRTISRSTGGFACGPTSRTTSPRWIAMRIRRRDARDDRPVRLPHRRHQPRGRRERDVDDDGRRRRPPSTSPCRCRRRGTVRS